MALGKMDTLLPHKPRKAEHLSEFCLIGLWNAYLSAKRFRVNVRQYISIFQDLEMEHCTLLVPKRGIMNCFFNFLDHGCMASLCCFNPMVRAQTSAPR